MTELTSEDRRWLDAAARFAAPFQGTTGDSPAVAALIVDPLEQTLVARAVTARAGRAHAEAQAIAAAGFEAAGRTLYVTLEPCKGWDRTPPCADAIIRSGIMRVVIGALDPWSQGSVAHLESAGIEVLVAQHAPSVALYAGRTLRQAESRPMVNIALVVSADGRLDFAQPGTLGRNWLDMLRSRSDAILVGAATAKADPDLTVRLRGLERRTPLRVVLSGATGVDRRLNLIGGFSGHRTAIIAQTDVAVDAPVSVETIRVAGDNGRSDLREILKALSARKVQNLLVEPGQRLLAALLEADLVDGVSLLTTTAKRGEGGTLASPDGPLADLLGAAGLVEIERQRLGDVTLQRYTRILQPV